jgi:tRNA A37 methylthiotransferase MiaB
VFPGLVYAARKRLVERRLDRVLEAQQPISASRLSRYPGKRYEVLIEERIQGESLFLGRTYAQAPEVDGLTVVRADGLEAGRFTRCRIVKVNGLDLEAVPE